MRTLFLVGRAAFTDEKTAAGAAAYASIIGTWRSLPAVSWVAATGWSGLYRAEEWASSGPRVTS
jgi:hypothetical protein